MSQDIAKKQDEQHHCMQIWPSATVMLPGSARPDSESGCRGPRLAARLSRCRDFVCLACLLRPRGQVCFNPT